MLSARVKHFIYPKYTVRSSIAGDIHCVFERDPAARSRFEVLTTYPGVQATIMYRLAHQLWQKKWCYSARLLSYFARIWTGVDIHPGAVIGDGFFIDHGAGVVIGETAEIANNVTLYHGVTLGGVSWNKGKRHPTLEEGVVVGAGAKILGPIIIGANSRVGANSVVINAVASGKTVVGIPGKVVQMQAKPADHDGIDLNHHLIPDPVADAMANLLQRIQQLESQLGIDGCIKMIGDDSERDDCTRCNSEDICSRSDG